jgi:hypothetical protein
LSDTTVDVFDRKLGALVGVPDVTSTKMSSIGVATQIVGDSQQFTVQTFRLRDHGDNIFITIASREGLTRVVLPPAVTEAIARQREALTAKSRSKAAKAVAQERKDRGELPGFMKKK